MIYLTWGRTSCSCPTSLKLPYLMHFIWATSLALIWYNYIPFLSYFIWSSSLKLLHLNIVNSTTSFKLTCFNYFILTSLLELFHRTASLQLLHINFYPNIKDLPQTTLLKLPNSNYFTCTTLHELLPFNYLTWTSSQEVLHLNYSLDIHPSSSSISCIRFWRSSYPFDFN